MLIRVVLLLATLLQAAAVSPGAAHARLQHPTFAAPVCKGDAIPAAPYSPIERNGACADCLACCNSHPPVVSIFHEVWRLARSKSRTVNPASAALLAPPKPSETPPARAPPA